MGDFEVPWWVWATGGVIAVVYIARNIKGMLGGSGDGSGSGGDKGLFGGLVEDIGKQFANEVGAVITGLTKGAIETVVAVPTGIYEGGYSFGYDAGLATTAYVNTVLAPSVTVPTSSGGYSEPIKSPYPSGGYTIVKVNDTQSLWLVDNTYLSGVWLPKNYTDEFFYKGANSVEYLVMTFSGLTAMDAYNFLKNKGY